MMARKPKITLHGPGASTFRGAAMGAPAVSKSGAVNMTRQDPRLIKSKADRDAFEADARVTEAALREAGHNPTIVPSTEKGRELFKAHQEALARRDAAIKNTREVFDKVHAESKSAVKAKVSEKIDEANESSKARSASLNKKLKRRGSKGGMGGGGPDDQPRVPAGSPEGGQWTEA